MAEINCKNSHFSHLSDAELEVVNRTALNEDEIICREWFFNKIDKLLDIFTPTNPNSNNNPTIKNVTVVFGHAGSGKTFLIQLLTKTKRFQNRIFMPFYCNSTSSTPIDFLSDFENKILEIFNVPLEKNASSAVNFNVNFRENLLKVLNKLSGDSAIANKHKLHSKRYLLLIDSIDIRPDICDLISSNLHAFPNWLHVIITARPKRYRGITKMFSGARKMVIDDIKKTNVYNDIMSYLCSNKEKITSNSAEISKNFLNKIVHKSNGSILYVKILLDCLEQEIFDARQLDFVGATLNGLYLAIFTNLFNSHSQFESDFKSILAMFDPKNNHQVSVVELKEAFNWNDEYADNLIELLSMHCLIVFTKNMSYIKLIHSSLFEWLGDIKLCTSRFICHSYHNPHPSESSSRRQNNPINTKYINDNDDSINDVSDDMLGDKDQSDNCKLIISDKTDQSAVNYSHLERKFNYLGNETQCSSKSNLNEKPNRKNNHFGKFDSSAEALCNNNSFVNNFESLTSNSLKNAQSKQFYGQIDDECVMGSEDEQLEEELSKTDISKEFLTKLFQKFENALHLCDLKTLRNILAKFSTVIVNQNFIDGKSPLYWAIKKSNVKLVELLIEYNADVNAICDPERGHTPLILAMMQHSYDMCELLLESDADVDLLDSYSLPPILHAIFLICSPEIIKLLLYWGAHTDYIDQSGRSLLHYAANELTTWPETITLLLTVGCDEMTRDNSGQTALHLAAANGSLQIVEILVEFGGDKLIHTQDKSGMLALHEAALNSNLSLCEPLITPKSINAVAHNGNTPLRIAILFYDLEMAELLILKGADINYKDADGRSILYCVVAFTHSTLEQKGPPFFNASCLADHGAEKFLDTAVKTIEFLVRFGIDLEMKDLEGRTALHVAAWQGTYAIVECLIQRGADINAIDNEGRTPLHMCSWNGHIEVVRLLVESGSMVNHVSSTQGATPLLVAAQQGHFDTCAYLLQVGSDVSHHDLYGRDARDVALNCGHNEIVMLIENFQSEGTTTTATKTSTIPASLNHTDDSDLFPSDLLNSMKLSKYDSRFYCSSSSNSVPNKKASRKNKKTRSISKFTKMLH